MIWLLPNITFSGMSTVINDHNRFTDFLPKISFFRSDSWDEDTRRGKCIEAFRKRLEDLNEAARREIQDYLSYAVENALAGLYTISLLKS